MKQDFHQWCLDFRTQHAPRLDVPASHRPNELLEMGPRYALFSTFEPRTVVELTLDRTVAAAARVALNHPQLDSLVAHDRIVSIPGIRLGRVPYPDARPAKKTAHWIWREAPLYRSVDIAPANKAALLALAVPLEKLRRDLVGRRGAVAALQALDAFVWPALARSARPIYDAVMHFRALGWALGPIVQNQLAFVQRPRGERFVLGRPGPALPCPPLTGPSLLPPSLP